MSRFLKSSLWSAVDSILAKGFQFAFGIFLARLLTPEIYGLIGTLSIFTIITQVLVEAGFSHALIQRNKNTDELYNSVSLVNMCLGLIAYLILYISAPYLASFFEYDNFDLYLRILALSLVISSFSIVHRTILVIRLDYKSVTTVTSVSTFVSGGVALLMAYKGYGVWSLITLTLINVTIQAILFRFYSKWRLSFVFAWKDFFSIWSFGKNMMISGLLNAGYKNFIIVLVSKFFSASELGLFLRAKQLVDFAALNITNVFKKVSFPALSEAYQQGYNLVPIFRRFLQYTYFVLAPLLVYLYFFSDDIILIILTEKWIKSAWMIKLLIFAGILLPLHVQNLDILAVKNKSEVFLKLEILKKIISITFVAFGASISIRMMLYSLVFSSMVSLLINGHYTKQLIGYSLVQQIRDISPLIILSCFAFYVSKLVVMNLPYLSFKVLGGILFGTILYVLGLILVNREVRKFIHELLVKQ